MRWLILGLLFFSNSSFAAFEDLGAGGRAPGMGGVFTAVADDVYTIYYNPAGLGTLDRAQLGTSYSKLDLGLTDNSDLSNSFVGYAQPLAKGRYGGLGVAWHNFSLNNTLYREDSFYLSYGLELVKDFYAGGSLKYLRSSFAALDEASNAFQGIIATRTKDPALENRLKGVLDSDAGLLYKFGPHYSLGLMAMHVNEPNIAFNPGQKDILKRQFKAGFNYGSLISNMGLQLDTAQSPDGSQDLIGSVAVERWFPRIFIGDFGFRGSLAVGTRDYKNMTTGMSYRSKRLAVDYAFAVPITSFFRAAGSHRLGFSFRFGGPGEKEETLEMVLDAMRQLRAGPAVTLAPATKGLTPEQKAILDEYLSQSRSLELEARYKDALAKLTSALGVAPDDSNLIVRFSRLNFAAQRFAQLLDYKSEPVQGKLHQGVLSYLGGANQEAVQKVAEALNINPRNQDVEKFLADIERVTGFKRPPPVLVAKPKSYVLARTLTRADAAIQAGEYRRAIDLSLEVLREDRENLPAWQNLGTAYFAVKDFESSLKAWNRALDLENSPAVRGLIKGYIRSIQRAMRGEEDRPKAVAGPKPVREAPPIPRLPTLSQEEIGALFDQGIDYYTRREFDKAIAVFEKILQADPDNVQAAKALRRVKEELPPPQR